MRQFSCKMLRCRSQSVWGVVCHTDYVFSIEPLAIYKE